MLSSNLWGHVGFLLLHIPNELDWVASPHLHWWDYSSRGNNAVRSNYSSLFDDGSLKHDWVLSDVGFFPQSAWVQGASILYHTIILNLQDSPQPWGCGCSSMKNTVIANIHVIMNPDNKYWFYMTALISPLMTVPCQILLSLPKNTSPKLVYLITCNCCVRSHKHITDYYWAQVVQVHCCPCFAVFLYVFACCL